MSTIVLRHADGRIETLAIGKAATIALRAGDTIQFPAGFAGQLALNQPAPGDLTLQTPAPNSQTIVLKGFANAITAGEVGLEIGATRADTLPELLNVVATTSGGEQPGGDMPPSSSGTPLVGAFQAEPLGRNFGSQPASDPRPNGEPALNAPAAEPGVASLPESTVETRFASLVGGSTIGGDTVPSAPPTLGQARVTVLPATGMEDSAIALSIEAGVSGTADSVQVLISGLPAGASLSADTGLGGGLWSVDASQLAGLAVIPPVNDDSALNLTVTVVATLGSDQSTATTTLPVTVIPVIDRLFTPGDDTIDLASLPDVSQPNPAGGPWAEDGNRSDAGDGNDVVTLASVGPNALPPGAVFEAGAGNDRITGGGGNDTIVGGSGNDTIHGAAGTDTAIFQGPLESYLFATDSDRRLVFSDQVAGRDGADTVTSVEHVIFAGTAFNLVTNAAAAPPVPPPAIDPSLPPVICSCTTIISPGPQDTLLGTDDRDLIVGIGPAVFIGGGGADVMLNIGSVIGSATFVIDAAAEHVAGEVIDGSAGGGANGRLLYDGQTPGETLVLQHTVTDVGTFQMYHLVGSLGGGLSLEPTTVDLNIDGSALTYGASFEGNLGDNTLTGTAFNDFLAGGSGTDLLFGGSGDDQFIFASAAELAADAIVAGGIGFDTIHFSGIVPPVALVDADLAQVSGMEMIDLIAPGTHTLILGQNADAAFVEGVFVSGNGNSTTLKVDGTALTVKLVVDRFHGPDSTITGGSANDTLSSGFGSDTIDGGAGTDTVVFNGNFADYSFTVNGGAFQVMDPVPIRDGTDTLSNVELLQFADQTLAVRIGDAGDNVLTGGDGTDTIYGLAGNDTLNGGAGSDYLHAGTGADTMDGGAGSDTILYRAIGEAGDTILNFDGDPAGGQDTIDLDGLLDALGIATGDRDDRVAIASGGANTSLLSVDADGDQGNGFEVGLASIASADQITIGQDIQLGQL